MASLDRLLRHLFTSRATMRRLFPESALDDLEKAIAVAEDLHSAEIRVVIEADLDVGSIFAGKTARDRAREVFGRFGVWDTEANNGLLIYLLLADRRVEIVADRGFRGLVSDAEWQDVCRTMESHFRAGRFAAGALAGVAAAGLLAARHFPPDGARNELPDRPVLL